MVHRKQEIELRNKELDQQKKEIELERMQGNLLHMDKAKSIISSYMRMYANGLFRELETYMEKVLNIYQVPLKDKAKYLSELEKIMNRTSDRTKQEMVRLLKSDDVK